jgi:hypothetical protein
MGDVMADDDTFDVACPSLTALAACEVIDVAAVELRRPMKEVEEVVDAVSRLRLYPIGGGDSDRVGSSPSASSDPVKPSRVLSRSVCLQRWKADMATSSS